MSVDDVVIRHQLSQVPDPAYSSWSQRYSARRNSLGLQCAYEVRLVPPEEGDRVFEALVIGDVGTRQEKLLGASGAKPLDEPEDPDRWHREGLGNWHMPIVPHT